MANSKEDLFHEKLPGIHKTIGFVNPLDMEYAAMNAIQSFKAFLEEHPSWQMKVIGFGPEYAALQNYIKTYGLSRKIMLYGPLSHGEIYDVIKRVDVVVIPSSHVSDQDKSTAVSHIGAPLVIHQDHPIVGHNNINQALLVHDGTTKNISEKIRLAVNSLSSFDVRFIRKQRLSQV